LLNTQDTLRRGKLRPPINSADLTHTRHTKDAPLLRDAGRRFGAHSVLESDLGGFRGGTGRLRCIECRDRPCWCGKVPAVLTTKSDRAIGTLLSALDHSGFSGTGRFGAHSLLDRYLGRFFWGTGTPSTHGTDHQKQEANRRSNRSVRLWRQSKSVPGMISCRGGFSGTGGTCCGHVPDFCQVDPSHHRARPT
jgi:hypothetical protein